MDIPTKKISEKKELRKKALKVMKRDRIITIGLLTLLFFLIVSGSFLIYLNSTKISDSSPDFIKKAYEINNRFFPKEQKISVLVNQEPIYADEVDKRYEIIPPEYKQFITKDDLVEQLIDEKILLQEAKKEDIDVKDETVDKYILNLSEQAGSSIEEFTTILESNGLTLDDAKAFYKKSLILNQLLEKNVFQNILVSDEDIESYYSENKAFFTTPESMNISHILICHNSSVRCVSNISKEEAEKRSMEVAKLAKTADFGELALEYSDEPAAVITKGNLGLINGESPLDATFLKAALDLKSGEVSQPIETVFGFHIIKAFSKVKEETTPLDAVKEQIYQTLFTQAQTDGLMDYISGLKNESEIVYLNK